jgi:hypothetical protein
MSGVFKKVTRGELQDMVARHVAGNPRYRAALVEDPKSVVERLLDTSLGRVKVEALLETADTVYVVVPHVLAEDELSDEDLDKVAGGGDSHIRFRQVESS